MNNGKPSLREKIRLYKVDLHGAVLMAFNRVFNEQVEREVPLQKAFVAAKEEAMKVAKAEKENA